MEPIKYCFTTWGKLLKVNSVRNGIVSVSDPDAIDVGQDISDSDIKTYHAGWRLRDKEPEDGEDVVIMTMDGEIHNATYINKSFGIRTIVLMWGPRDQPYWND